MVATRAAPHIVDSDKMYPYIRLHAHIDLLLGWRNAFQGLDACLQFLLSVFTISSNLCPSVGLTIIDLQSTREIVVQSAQKTFAKKECFQ